MLIIITIHPTGSQLGSNSVATWDTSNVDSHNKTHLMISPFVRPRIPMVAMTMGTYLMLVM